MCIHTYIYILVLYYILNFILFLILQYFPIKTIIYFILMTVSFICDHETRTRYRWRKTVVLTVFPGLISFSNCNQFLFTFHFPCQLFLFDSFVSCFLRAFVPFVPLPLRLFFVHFCISVSLRHFFFIVIL